MRAIAETQQYRRLYSGQTCKPEMKRMGRYLSFLPSEAYVLMARSLSSIWSALRTRSCAAPNLDVQSSVNRPKVTSWLDEDTGPPLASAEGSGTRGREDVTVTAACIAHCNRLPNRTLAHSPAMMEGRQMPVGGPSKEPWDRGQTSINSPTSSPTVLGLHLPKKIPQNSRLPRPLQTVTPNRHHQPTRWTTDKPPCEAQTRIRTRSSRPWRKSRRWSGEQRRVRRPTRFGSGGRECGSERKTSLQVCRHRFCLASTNWERRSNVPESPWTR